MGGKKKRNIYIVQTQTNYTMAKKTESTTSNVKQTSLSEQKS